jgi:hypothetical protein
MIKPILLGAALSLVASSAALALPNISSGAKAPSDVWQVGERDHDRGDHWRKRDRWDDRYSYEDRDFRYRGKHRYSYRPRDWEERGCFSVGPFWYCS